MNSKVTHDNRKVWAAKEAHRLIPEPNLAEIVWRGWVRMFYAYGINRVPNIREIAKYMNSQKG